MHLGSIKGTRLERYEFVQAKTVLSQYKMNRASLFQQLLDYILLQTYNT